MNTNVRSERLYSKAIFSKIEIKNTDQFLYNGAKSYDDYAMK